MLGIASGKNKSAKGLIVILVFASIYGLWVSRYVKKEHHDWLKQTVLGNEHFSKGNLNNAQKHYYQALLIAQKFEVKDSRLATSYNNLAAVSRRMRDYGKAETYYKLGLKILETPRGFKDKEAATLLRNYAKLLQQKGQFEESKKYFDLAIKVFERYPDELKKEHRRTLNDYLNLLIQLRDQEGAGRIQAKLNAL